MEQPSFTLHLCEQRRGGVWGENVKRGTFQPVPFDPFGRALENVRAIVIEAENKTAVHLNAVVVKDGHAPGIVIRPWTLFARIRDIAAVQRFESDENSRAAGQRHRANK